MKNKVSVRIFLSAIFLILCFNISTFASELIRTKVMDNVTVGAGSSNVSSSVRVKRSSFDGKFGMLVSANDTVTVTQQCSIDDANWYDPFLTNTSQTGQVATADTSYVVFSPVVAPYIRFNVSATNSTNVTLELIRSEE